MRKLYLLVGLLALVPITYAAGCGNSDTGSGGGNSSGTAGGQVQNFVFEIDVDWTIQQQKPTTANCGGAMEYQVLVRLSGTEDPSDHKEKTVSCTGGPVKFTNLTRLQAGSTLDVEGFLQTSMGVTGLSTFQTVTPTAGVVAVHLDFSTPNPVTSTTAGPGPSTTSGGMGGMGGAGGAGGASSSSEASSTRAASTSSSHSSTAASTAASTGSG